MMMNFDLGDKTLPPGLERSRSAVATEAASTMRMLGLSMVTANLGMNGMVSHLRPVFEVFEPEVEATVPQCLRNMRRPAVESLATMLAMVGVAVLKIEFESDAERAESLRFWNYVATGAQPVKPSADMKTQLLTTLRRQGALVTPTNKEVTDESGEGGQQAQPAG